MRTTDEKETWKGKSPVNSMWLSIKVDETHCSRESEDIWIPYSTLYSVILLWEIHGQSYTAGWQDDKGTQMHVIPKPCEGTSRKEPEQHKHCLCILLLPGERITTKSLNKNQWEQVNMRDFSLI